MFLIFKFGITVSPKIWFELIPKLNKKLEPNTSFQPFYAGWRSEKSDWTGKMAIIVVHIQWDTYSNVHKIFANTTWPKEEEEQKDRLHVINQLRRSSVVLSVRFLPGHLDASRPPFHNLLATEAENLITVSAGPGRACRVIYRPSVSSGYPLPARYPLPWHSLMNNPCRFMRPVTAPMRSLQVLIYGASCTPGWSLQNFNLKVRLFDFLCVLHDRTTVLTQSPLVTAL